MRFLVSRIAQVRRIVPEHVYAHTHARRDEVPEIPLAKQNPGAMEIAAVDARAAISSFARHIHALEMSADENRPWSRRRSGQETLGAPEEKVVTDQEAVTALLT